jgi:hypothetical protein
MTSIRGTLSALLVLLAAVGNAAAQAGPVGPVIEGVATAVPSPGVARAVLFHSENCPHCSDVIYRDLPPIQELFGPSLQVVQLQTEDPLANVMYEMAKRMYIAEGEVAGVPMMIIGDRALVGARAVREEFAVLVQTHLTQGGVDWPGIPGLRESLAAPPEPTEAPPEPTATAPEPTEAASATPAFTPTPSASPVPAATPTPEPTGRTIGGTLRQAGVLLAVAVVLGAGLWLVQRLRGRSA